MSPQQRQLREELRRSETDLIVLLRSIALVPGADDRKWVSFALSQVQAGFRSARLAVDQMEDNVERVRCAA